jgi:hypothetical protein
MLEKIGFEKLVNESMAVTRTTKVVSLYQFILAIVLGLYIGFARLINCNISQGIRFLPEY